MIVYRTVATIGRYNGCAVALSVGREGSGDVACLVECLPSMQCSEFDL